MDQKTKVFIVKFHEIWGKDQKKGLHLEICADFHEFWVEDKKNFFISKNARISTNFGVKPQKKGLYYKICEKTVLAHEFRGDNQYLGSLRRRTALQWHRASNFVWSTILAWGHNSRLGGARPRNAPVASCLLQVYSNLLNSNYRIFVKEILLKIAFIEEIRTI